ncbi:hypothetical protein [Cystobacter fuscus]|uniref:hypothetical protein n=1 Tax=Cystobacter fuscus TaxID=43 RepID=UPI002B31452D|nr:hypothetical protein F0U63_04175 [Cystobacter fuscus]
MTPALAGLMLIFLLRAFSNRRSGRQRSNPSYSPQVGYFGITLFFLLPQALFQLVWIVQGQWWITPFFLGLLTLCLPWTTTRWVFIPLGWPRVAYGFSYLAAWSWGADPKGGRVLAAAWALLRARTPPTQEYDHWLRQHLETTCTPKRGAALVASALLAASRGDLETARLICRGMNHLDPRVAPRLARKIALEWSLADAAAHGRWREVIELARSGSGSFLLAAFFRDSARRLLGEPSVGRFVLGMEWVLARRWVSTWPLLERAWRATPHASSPGETPVATEPLEHALACHAALARVTPGHEEAAFSSAVSAWEQALDSERVRELVEERARGAGPGVDAHEALETLRHEVTEELAAWALARELPLHSLATGSALLEAVTYQACNEQLERIESIAWDMSRRMEEKQPLPSSDVYEQWRDFLALQRRCARVTAMGGLDARRLAFEAVNVPLCNLGAWLFNVREERAVANGMFRWLLAEARVVGSQEDQQRYLDNVNCGP